MGDCIQYDPAACGAQSWGMVWSPRRWQECEMFDEIHGIGVLEAGPDTAPTEVSDKFRWRQSKLPKSYEVIRGPENVDAIAFGRQIDMYTDIYR